MEIDLEVLKELSEEYGISLNAIKSYCNRLMGYDFVKDNDESLFYECLERIVQDACTNEFIKEKSDSEDDQKKIEYSISDALYNVYGDDVLSYLDEDYINENQQKYGL